MEIAIGVVFLAIFLGVIFLLFALLGFVFWRVRRRKKANSPRTFYSNPAGSVPHHGSSSQSSDDFEDSYYPTSSANVIVPAAVGAVVGEQIYSNYQESQNEAGGNWEYTNYENTDSVSSSESSDSSGSYDSSSSCSSADSGSSCSSCSSGGSSD